MESHKWHRWNWTRRFSTSRVSVPDGAEHLVASGIRTVGDLLLYFPRRFNLRRQVQLINTLQGDEPAVTVAGVVSETDYKPFGRKPYFECSLDDGTGWVVAKWFHGGYLKDRIKPGMHLAVNGRISVYKETLQFVNPRFDVIWSPEETNLQADELLPVYPACGPIPSGLISRFIKNVSTRISAVVRAVVR